MTNVDFDDCDRLWQMKLRGKWWQNQDNKISFLYLFFVQGLKCKGLGVRTPAKLVLGPATTKKLKSHQEIRILHSWNFQDVAISSIYICIGAHCLANIYLSSYVHCRQNICHQCGNIFGNSCDFNCHFFSTSNMWSLLYHPPHKSYILPILLHHSYCHISNWLFIVHRNISATFWFKGNNSVTFVYICLLSTILWHLHRFKGKNAVTFVAFCNFCMPINYNSITFGYLGSNLKRKNLELSYTNLITTL